MRTYSPTEYWCQAHGLVAEFNWFKPPAALQQVSPGTPQKTSTPEPSGELLPRGGLPADPARTAPRRGTPRARRCSPAYRRSPPCGSAPRTTRGRAWAAFWATSVKTCRRGSGAVRLIFTSGGVGGGKSPRRAKRRVVWRRRRRRAQRSAGAHSGKTSCFKFTRVKSFFFLREFMIEKWTKTAITLILQSRCKNK